MIVYHYSKIAGLCIPIRATMPFPIVETKINDLIMIKQKHSYMTEFFFWEFFYLIIEVFLISGYFVEILYILNSPLTVTLPVLTLWTTAFIFF